MKLLTALFASLLLAACASTPAPERPAQLYNDRLFITP